MGIVSVEKRLSRLEAAVFKNKTESNEAIEKMEYIAACEI